MGKKDRLCYKVVVPTGEGEDLNSVITSCVGVEAGSLIETYCKFHQQTLISCFIKQKVTCGCIYATSQSVHSYQYSVPGLRCN
jgi:hypothetical protein